MWNVRFFEFLSATLGIYVCSDDYTSRGVRMDVARIMTKTRCALEINEVLNILINNKLFIIKLMEEAPGSRGKFDSEKLEG